MASSAEVDVIVAYHLVGFYDGEVDETVPTPRETWVGVGTSAVLFRSAEDIYLARIRFESWDGPAPADDASWPLSESAALYLPSGVLSIHEIDGGNRPRVFTVGPPGHYSMRLGWRAGEMDPAVARPQAFALAQFWPAGA
jgi:hypothetical protein